MRKFPVFYRPEMVAFQPNDKSPSAHKPKEVVEDWQSHFGSLLEIHSFEPVVREDYYLAHDEKFVDDILECREDNGFENRSPEVAASLPYTTGSLLSAARQALRNGKVACSPTSGFHHATWEQAMGFCTFNGLMVTAIKLLNEGMVKKVGILDLDHHWGNGTHDIIHETKANVHHYSIGSARLHFRVTLEDGLTVAEWWMRERLPWILSSFSECDLILYQAGADLWEEDPYAWHGGLDLEQLRRRDDLVFSFCKLKRIPVVWNLAGGYKKDENDSIEPVLRIHRQTLVSCLSAYGITGDQK